MALLPDYMIRRLCVGVEPTMIDPFSDGVDSGGVISYGLSHAGYDLRLGPEVLLFKNSVNEVIDPKRFMDDAYRRRMFDELELAGGRLKLNRHDVGEAKGARGNAFVIPPHGYILGRSLEYLRIPRWLKGRCVGKSTLARSGILVNTTPLEPGWEGHLTIEIGNITHAPAMVYVAEGVAQLEFEQLLNPPMTDYAQKKGKYQSQTGVTPARVKT